MAGLKEKAGSELDAALTGAEAEQGRKRHRQALTITAKQQTGLGRARLSEEEGPVSTPGKGRATQEGKAGQTLAVGSPWTWALVDGRQHTGQDRGGGQGARRRRKAFLSQLPHMYSREWSTHLGGCLLKVPKPLNTTDRTRAHAWPQPPQTVGL